MSKCDCFDDYNDFENLRTSIMEGHFECFKQLYTLCKENELSIDEEIVVSSSEETVINVDEECIINSIIYNQREIFDFLIKSDIDNKVKKMEYICQNAARLGNLYFLKTLRKNGFEWDFYVFNSCLDKHHDRSITYKCFKYAAKNSCPLVNNTWYEALEMKDIKYIKILSRYYQIPNDVFLYARAIKIGFFKGFKFLHKKGVSLPTDVCVYAAKKGNIECLQYAIENGCLMDYDACYEAAYKGQLDSLKILYKHRCPWDVMTTQNAADQGHMKCLKYALKRGCPAPSFSSNYESLIYLHKNYNLEWTTDDIATVSEMGKLSTLKYMHENGCPWNEDTIEWANGNEFYDCVLYAYKNGCPGREKYHNCIKNELLKDNMKIFRAIIVLTRACHRFRLNYYKPGNTGYNNRKKDFFKRIPI